jgi:hypothetical protein
MAMATSDWMFGRRRAATVKKGVPHAWCNVTDTPVRILIVFSPGHIEAMFRQIIPLATDDLEKRSRQSLRISSGRHRRLPIVRGLNTLASPRPSDASEARGARRRCEAQQY